METNKANNIKRNIYRLRLRSIEEQRGQSRENNARYSITFEDLIRFALTGNYKGM